MKGNSFANGPQQPCQGSQNNGGPSAVYHGPFCPCLYCLMDGSTQ